MKKIILSLLIIFISLPAPSWADEITVRGRVVDQNNEPLPGCWVSAGKTKYTVYIKETNYDGYFELNLDPTDYNDFTIDCSTFGYEVKYMPIITGKNDYGTIQMIPKPDSENIEASTAYASADCTELALRYANANSGRIKIIKQEDETTKSGEKALSICDPDCDPTSQIKIKKTIQYKESEFPKPENWNTLNQKEREELDEQTKNWTAPREILYCSDECTESDQQTLKEQGAKKTKILNKKCIPSKCDEPRYKLEYADSTLAQCVDQDGQDCHTNLDDPYALGSVYEYDENSNELNCVSVSCIEGYELDKQTKKCMVTPCPCGQEERNNECVAWEETGNTQCKRLPRNAATAERACKGDEEYCKILTCKGDEYKIDNLHEFEVAPDGKKCVSREKKECKPTTAIKHGKEYEYKKSNTPYKLFCAVTKCGANYVPNDEGTQCIPSDCTKEQEETLKAAHAASWKLADNKKDCIPTKCQCGYGNKDGEPVNGTCNTLKWSWEGDIPPEGTKKPCDDIDNASEAYMDCREDGKAYCRVYKCENEFTLYGNECIQGACDPNEFPNALYVKRVGDRCVIQECETGYDVKDNECVARNDLLSEEDSEARIKKLQENEDAVAENAQRIENKLMDTLGIGGAGMGGQMMASGIAQKTADEAAERDMTAYLATFRCKYGNESVDSGGDEVQLPGANDAKYDALLSEYKTLAASLKLSKNALGMAPGIESDEILDGSTLYGRGNTGGADGAYLSLADALSGDKDAQNEWDDQKEKARDMAIGGGVLAGASIIGSAVGSYFENKNAAKNKADEINDEYDAKRGPINPEESTEATTNQ